MLRPAILYAEQITEGFQKLLYTDTMYLETGYAGEQYVPDITEVPEGGRFNYAIVDSNDEVIGFISYDVDYYISKAYNFGLISFDRGNPLVGKDLFSKMEELVNIFHRVEWRMVGGNPVERSYDKFCKMHNGTKHILKDALKDNYGKYRDDVIYEIVKEQ